MRVALPLFVLAVALPSHAQYPGSVPEHASRPQLNSAAISAAMLQAHNTVRAQVGVPPLVWSDRLAVFAQEWADHLVAAHTFQHRPNNKFGENLYMIEGGSASPPEVVGDWADESKQYDIHTNTCTDVCGHYTQIVWAKTRAVGCAAAAARTREVWVCNYDPPGNYVGYRPY
jgi:pathogenesis-related protein 1